MNRVTFGKSRLPHVTDSTRMCRSPCRHLLRLLQMWLSGILPLVALMLPETKVSYNRKSSRRNSMGEAS